MSYIVVGITGNSVEIWDGTSYSEPKHNTRATMRTVVGEPHDFQVGDKVDLVVVLKERPEPKT